MAAGDVKFALGLTGQTLTFTAFQPDGTLRGTADQSLPEVGVSGYYTATPDTALVAGDIISVYHDEHEQYYQQEFMPEVSATGVVGTLEGRLDDIDAANTEILLESQKTTTDYSPPAEEAYNPLGKL